MPHDYSAIAQETARILLDIEAIRLRPENPFTLVSGGKSPAYVNCRRIIRFPQARTKLMEFATTLIQNKFSQKPFDAIAGGETAGIPFAAFIAERLDLPMCYVRKKPKGYGMNLLIEGGIEAGERVLFVDDQASDGKSKVGFVKSLREAGAEVGDALVVFFYDIFPHSQKQLTEAGINLHALATWRDVLAVAGDSGKVSDSQLQKLTAYVNDPIAWSIDHGGTPPGEGAKTG